MLKPDVFIAYSHQDRGFASKLARDLFQAEQRVWWDEWEMRVGDSLLGKIGEAIKSAGYLVVVLSPNSVNSEWVNRELNAALSREMREKRVVVLPCLIAECEMPTFLQDKIFADFRSRYEQGFADLLHALAPPDIGTHRRQEEPERHFNDYAFDWGKVNGTHAFRLDIVSHGPEASFSVLLQIRWFSNEALGKRFQQFEEAGFDWAPSSLALWAMMEMVMNVDGRILISGDHEAELDLSWVDPNRDVAMHGHVGARRLGPHEGDLLFEFASIVRFALEQHREAIHKAVGQEALDAWARFVVENPPE